MFSKKKNLSRPAKPAWREALEMTCRFAIFALRVLIEAVVITCIISLFAGGVIPWVMTMLAGGLGLDASTALLDLVFIYGASGLFLVIIMSLGAAWVIGWVHRYISKVHRFLDGKLYRKGDEL